MRRTHHFRHRSKEAPELDMTTFLNLMVVLVPFLLITAVFSRITIVELSLPTSAGGASAAEPPVRVEVIVRQNVLQVSDGRGVIATFPKVEDEYDLEKLSRTMTDLKRRHPDKSDASVLLEPSIAYDHLIQVMDVVRTRHEPGASPDSGVTQIALFGDISIGDAP